MNCRQTYMSRDSLNAEKNLYDFLRANLEDDYLFIMFASLLLSVFIKS